MIPSIDLGGLVKEWPEHGVSLYRDTVNADYLAVEAIQEKAKERRTFTAHPLDISTAVSLIHFFEDVISERLKRYPIFRRDTYLPRFYADAMQYRQENWEQLRPLKVALFGQQHGAVGRVYDLSYYVFHETERKLVFESRETTALDSEFFDVALGNESLRFRAIVLCNDMGEVTHVGTKRCSLIDRNVLMDEDHWTVTLISITTQNSCRTMKNSWGKIFQNSVGHAAIVCEGIDRNQGMYIKRYIHLTNDPSPENRHPELQAGEAQIEIRDTIGGNTLHGPTWIRSRDLVERMIQYARTLHLKRVKFAAVGGTLYLHRTVFTLMTGEFPYGKDFFYTYPHTCLEWTAFLLKICGIFLLKVTPLTRPLQRVKELKEGKFYQVPRHFLTILARSISGEIDIKSDEYQQYLELQRNAKKMSAMIVSSHWDAVEISLAEEIIFKTSVAGLVTMGILIAVHKCV